MLASLIPIGGVDGGDFLAPQGLEKPLLALLGGFSAAVVYRILQRLVDSVESLVRGDVRDTLAAQEQATKEKMAEQDVQNRLQLAARLTKLQQQMPSAQDPDAIAQELERIQSDLLTPGSYDEKGIAS
jgi:hypothetical protein